MIPLDFVAGTHGHFFEYVLNRGLGYTPADFLPFNSFGSSHNVTIDYRKNCEIQCNHWFEINPDIVHTSDRVIRIVFDQDDLLLVNSISLLRAADFGIHNNWLHQDTVSKLNNKYYNTVLDEIYQAYPFLDKSNPNIPRYVLREFFKFGFSNPDSNGYWCKLQSMLSIPVKNEFRVNLKCFYDTGYLIDTCQKISSWLDRPFDHVSWLPSVHEVFKSKISFLQDKTQCDKILDDVMHRRSRPIPDLNLFQESYINGRLERLLSKEMPFHQDYYFKNTDDMLQYIHTQAPDL